jgi:hypothetical protein
MIEHESMLKTPAATIATKTTTTTTISLDDNDSTTTTPTTTSDDVEDDHDQVRGEGVKKQGMIKKEPDSETAPCGLTTITTTCSTCVRKHNLTTKTTTITTTTTTTTTSDVNNDVDSYRTQDPDEANGFNGKAVNCVTVL